MPVVEIKAGTTLDRAVAKAIGQVSDTRPHPQDKERILGWEIGGWWDGDEYVGPYPQKYSTDLNAAFAAAEAAFDKTLPDSEGATKYNREDRRWSVSRLTDDEGNVEGYECRLEYFDEGDYYVQEWRSRVESQAQTAALAICAAILSLKEQSDE